MIPDRNMGPDSLVSFNKISKASGNIAAPNGEVIGAVYGLNMYRKCYYVVITCFRPTFHQIINISL